MSGFFVKPCNADDVLRVSADSPINGDGTSASPLKVDTPVLAAMLADGVTTQAVDGKLKAVASTTNANITNTVAAQTDSTLRGNGTDVDPLKVNVGEIADGSTINEDSGKLKVNLAALVDGTSVMADGGKLKVNFPADMKGVVDAELSGSNIVFKGENGVTIRSLNIGAIIPAAAADRFLKGVRYDSAGQQFVFTVGDNTNAGNDQVINVPAADLIPVTAGTGIKGKGTTAEPLAIDFDATLTLKEGKLSVVPQPAPAERDCVSVTSIDDFGRNSARGFECFIADYRTTIGLPMDFPSTASEQEATTQLYPNRTNIYSGFKIGTADGAIVYVYENTTDGRAIGWSRTYQGRTSSKWVRETALIPPTVGGTGGLSSVSVSQPITGTGVAGSPLGIDVAGLAKRVAESKAANVALAASLADGTSVVASDGKLTTKAAAEAGAEVTGIGESATAKGIYLGNNLYLVEAKERVATFAASGSLAGMVNDNSQPTAVTVAKAEVRMPEIGNISNNQATYKVSGISANLSNVTYSGAVPGVANPMYLALPVKLRDNISAYAANTVVGDAFVAGVSANDASRLFADLNYRFLVRVPETAPYGVHKKGSNSGNTGGAVTPAPVPPANDSDKPQHGVAGPDTVFRFANAVVGKEWATSDDGKVVISTDDSIARKGNNWNGLVIDTPKGKAVHSQVADETRGYLGVFADVDAFNITADKTATLFVPFRIDGIGNRPAQFVISSMNGDDATGGTLTFAVAHETGTDSFSIPRQSRTGVTINGGAITDETRLLKGQTYILQYEIVNKAFTALRLGAPAGGNGGISATFFSGMRLVEGLDDSAKRQYLQQLATQYDVQLA